MPGTHYTATPRGFSIFVNRTSNDLALSPLSSVIYSCESFSDLAQLCSLHSFIGREVRMGLCGFGSLHQKNDVTNLGAMYLAWPRT